MPKRGIKSHWHFFQRKIEEDKNWQTSIDALLVSCCRWLCDSQLTEAAEDVVEVVEIIIAFLQNCFVAIGDVDQSVGVSHCAGAEKQIGEWGLDKCSLCPEGYKKMYKKKNNTVLITCFTCKKKKKSINVGIYRLCLWDLLAAVGVDYVRKELHPHNCEGVVEDD